MNSFSSSTICAVATAPGMGGIAVIRISGCDAFSVVSQHLQRKGVSIDVASSAPRRAIYAEWYANEQLIDDVVVLPFFAPHSYTGENVVEISCHGSTYITHRILDSLVQSGAEMARPGEFTQRAYLNGRLNLSEAEAVADIIASETEAQHRIAMQQMRGGYSAQLARLRSELLRLTSLMELELDFAEEDVTFADRTELDALVQKLSAQIKGLIDSYRLGNAVRMGIPVAIVGATNVGKSTLLNALLGEERAIVSDIHGTTRDTVEDTVNIGGYLFRFVDTAGLRHTEDEIESIGIERSRSKMQSSEIVLGVLDASRFFSDKGHTDTLSEILHTAAGRNLLLLVNKRDLIDKVEQTKIQEKLREMGVSNEQIIPISAQTPSSIDVLRSRLIDIIETTRALLPDIIVSNVRHLQLFGETLSALNRLQKGFSEDIPTDLLTLELRHAIDAIGEITGEAITNDDTLHYIFGHFCIGK